MIGKEVEGASELSGGVEAERVDERRILSDSDEQMR